MYSPPLQQKETHTFIANIHEIVKHRSKIKYSTTAERNTHIYKYYLLLISMRLSNTGAKSNTPRQQKEHTHILLLISMRLLNTGGKSNTPLQQKETHTFIVNIHETVKHRRQIKYPSSLNSRKHTHIFVC